MKRKHQRLAVVLLCLTGLGLGTALVLTALGDELMLFYSPSDLAENEIGPGQRIRLGGLVADDSITSLPDGPGLRFTVTDGPTSLDVIYRGLPPDLFQEGQGMMATGGINADGVFIAESLLAKHDENYMPPEVADALARAGHPEEAF